jgi:crotonyl-CoA carboxylase/reductase
MSRAFTYEELPLAHQLMHDNHHPHGNMAVLIGAPQFGLGKSAEAPAALPEVHMPKSDVHDTPHPYPLSAPLPGMEPVPGGEAFVVHDDGSKVRDQMHKGIIFCGTYDTLEQAAKIMIDNDVHAVVVIDGDKAVGVVSQTDIVMARQGRTADEARKLLVGDFMTAGCTTVEAYTPLSSAITEMMRRRIHRLVVTDGGKPIGVLSMTDIVRKVIA